MTTDALINRLKISGLIRSFSGTINCSRISANSVAASASRVSAVAMNSSATVLWSALVARSIHA